MDVKLPHTLAHIFITRYIFLYSLIVVCLCTIIFSFSIYLFKFWINLPKYSTKRIYLFASKYMHTFDDNTCEFIISVMNTVNSKRKIKKIKKKKWFKRKRWYAKERERNDLHSKLVDERFIFFSKQQLQ